MATGLSVAVSVNAGLASAQAEARDVATSNPAALVGLSVSVAPNVEVASATGWASQGVSAILSVDVENAAATADATDIAVQQPNPFLNVSVGLASATATALDIISPTDISAGNAAATADAPAPSISISVNVGIASATAVASGSTAQSVTRPKHGGVHVSTRITASVTRPRTSATVTVPGRDTTEVSDE